MIELVLPSTTRVHNPKGKSIGSAISAQLTAESPYTLQNCPFSWGIWTPSNSWILGPFWAHNPNRISIG